MLAAILDVVGSRDHPDQQRLLRGVATAAEHWLVEVGAARSSGPTVGDEVQALYEDADTGRCVRDVARLRLALRLDPPAPRPVDLRAGFGVGAVAGDGVEADAPGQSGPAWWAARAALEHVTRRRNGWPVLGWWYDGPGAPAIQAALVGLETLWTVFDQVDLRAAAGLLDGRTAATLADELGLSRSTLSERLHRHGVYGWVRTIETLEAVDRGEGEA